MIVLGSALDLPPAVTIAGVGLMIFACVLAVVALVLTARLRHDIGVEWSRSRSSKAASSSRAMVHDRCRQAGISTAVDH